MKKTVKYLLIIAAIVAIPAAAHAQVWGPPSQPVANQSSPQPTTTTTARTANSVGVFGLAYNTQGPTRVLDTRQTAPIPAYSDQNVSLSAYPPGAIAYNVTVVNGTDAGNLIIWNTGDALPGTSAVNWTAGGVVGNFNITKDASGSITIHNASAGSVDVIVDVVGAFG